MKIYHIYYLICSYRSSVTSRPRRPDRAVYVPRARRSQTTPPKSTSIQLNATPDTNVPPNTIEQTLNDSAIKNLHSQIRIRSSAPSSPAAKQSQVVAGNHQATAISTTINSEPTTNGVNHCDILNQNGSLSEESFSNVSSGSELISQLTSSHTDNMDNQHTGTGLRIEDVHFEKNNRHNAKEDKDEKELQRASKVSIVIILGECLIINRGSFMNYFTLIQRILR